MVPIRLRPHFVQNLVSNFFQLYREFILITFLVVCHKHELKIVGPFFNIHYDHKYLRVKKIYKTIKTASTFSIITKLVMKSDD